MGDSVEFGQLLQQAAGGDSNALSTLFQQHRERLKRMVALRLDRRLQKRVDAVGRRPRGPDLGVKSAR